MQSQWKVSGRSVEGQWKGNGRFGGERRERRERTRRQAGRLGAELPSGGRVVLRGVLPRATGDDECGERLTRCRLGHNHL